MATSARKQREIAQRERLILDVARRMFVQRGYLGLNMDRVAEATEYSKGTVYQHFGSKEELLAGLATDTIALRLDMFRRAARFHGRSRERITAVGVADDLFVKLNPDHFAVEHVLDVGSVFGKIGEGRQERYLQLKRTMMDVLMGVVEDAVRDGDLTLPEGQPPCTVLNGLWTMSIGHHQLSSQVPLPPFDAVDLHRVHWTNYNTFLDGSGWTPLSADWDYGATIDRIHAEAFPAEYEQTRALDVARSE